jgi:hypothetical protein
MPERRETKRRRFSYYMRVLDDSNQELVGHLADISTRGFKLDCTHQIPLGRDFRLRMDLTADVSDRPYITFSARTKWCKADVNDPFLYNIGFEIASIGGAEGEIFNRIVQKYGTDSPW